MDENGQKRGLGYYALCMFSSLVLLFLVAPVLIVAIISLNDSRILSFPPETISLRWFDRIVADPAWRHSLWVSVQVALLATCIATAAGFLASFALIRASFRIKTGIYAFILAPMIVPNIIVAIAFYMAFAPFGASGSIIAMSIGHALLALPVTTVMLTANLQALDERYERAALSLGASQWQTMYMITLPLMLPGLISAALFAFLTSFDELLIGLFLSGIRTQTLTVRIWNSLSLQFEPTIAAVSTMLIGLTVTILVFNALLQRTK
jgi:putative spermidine/putrescine transport system permease protein